MKQTLLANAVASIEIGIEDYMSDNQARQVISSVRNLYAGVLLLLKEKLVRLSGPNTGDALIKSRLQPKVQEEGRLVWIGKGARTVNVYEIKERYKSLSLSVDWSHLDTLSKIRNNVEHYRLQSPVDQVREALAKTFLLVEEILHRHLDTSPAELFDSSLWAELLEEKELFEKLDKKCKESRSSLSDIPSDAEELVMSGVECIECGSRLTEIHKGTSYFTAEYRCKTCSEQGSLTDLIPRALKRRYRAQIENAPYEGCRPPVERCWHCSKEGFLLNANQCLVCGEEPAACIRCGESLQIDNPPGRLCSWCSKLGR